MGMTKHKILSKAHPTPAALLKLDATITLGRLAAGTHLSDSYLSKIFNGHRTPSLSTAARIAANLGCSLDTLYITLRKINK
jgi:transcriptional regulator with XRE-family HTH domain